MDIFKVDQIKNTAQNADINQKVAWFINEGVSRYNVEVLAVETYRYWAREIDRNGEQITDYFATGGRIISTEEAAEMGRDIARNMGMDLDAMVQAEADKRAEIERAREASKDMTWGEFFKTLGLDIEVTK